MATSDTQLYTVAGVLVILFAVILYNNVAAMRARSKARQASQGPGHEGPVHPLLVKFARHEGSIVGETVAIDGDRLIVKQAGSFKAVPVAQAAVEGDDVVLTGAIDWAAAEMAGAEWHQSTRKADAGVSGELTKSSDVKSPALESMRRDG
ncbi:MAG TPA: DUF5749 family beta-barrel protein [Candidatus Thermoplasmatota archaeon]|nr:DUF5749 family beta-barrel protein [Candidatus Thermoplasmatota archaeon]